MGLHATPALGCEDSATSSWMPYHGSVNNWVYVGCDVTEQCEDHVKQHGNPSWDSDRYGASVDCMVPASTCFDDPMRDHADTDTSDQRNWSQDSDPLCDWS